MDVYESIIQQNERYSLYNVRRAEYQNADELPFRVSPTPFEITKNQEEELFNLGYIICMYLNAVIALYNKDETLKAILDKFKLDIFLKSQVPHYLFVRPDLILTPDGFSICELETSVFGLALAEVLNQAYIDCNHETVLQENMLKEYITSQIPEEGIIAYSERVKAFKGQLNYLADQVFSFNGKNWKAEEIDEKFIYNSNIYRAFYSSDCVTERSVADLVKSQATFIPTLTPQFEEKAILAFLWDKRFSSYFKRKLGSAEFSYLRKVIPPTWIVGEEANFEPGMPGGITNLSEIATLPKSKRKLVLKKSGDSSWGEGITFFHKVSHEKAKSSLQTAIDSNSLYIVQEFREGKKVNMDYLTETGIQTMQSKVRITPYYAFSGKKVGQMIAIKATGCENTDYIHGATNSINTAVSTIS